MTTNVGLGRDLFNRLYLAIFTTQIFCPKSDLESIQNKANKIIDDLGVVQSDRINREILADLLWEYRSPIKLDPAKANDDLERITTKTEVAAQRLWLKLAVDEVPNIRMDLRATNDGLEYKKKHYYDFMLGSDINKYNPENNVVKSYKDLIEEVKKYFRNESLINLANKIDNDLSSKNISLKKFAKLLSEDYQTEILKIISEVRQELSAISVVDYQAPLIALIVRMKNNKFCALIKMLINPLMCPVGDASPYLEACCIPYQTAIHEIQSFDPITQFKDNP